MSILFVILVGFCVGALARVFMPGSDPGSFVTTTLLGIAGAIVATLLGKAIGWYGEGQASGFIAAVLGASLLLFGYRSLKRV